MPTQIAPPFPFLDFRAFTFHAQVPFVSSVVFLMDGVVAVPIGVVGSCPLLRDSVRSSRRHPCRALLPPVPWVPCRHCLTGSLCLRCFAPWAPRPAAACPDAHFIFCIRCKSTKHACRVCNFFGLLVCLFLFLSYSSLVNHLHTLCFSADWVPTEAEAAVSGVLYADVLWRRNAHSTYVFLESTHLAECSTG